MRQRLVFLAAAAALAAGVASLLVGSSSADAHCGPSGAKTLAVSSQARVYAIGKTVFGCAMKGTGAFRLGERFQCVGTARVAPVVAAGELAAYGLERCGVDTGFTQVVVRRLTDGKKQRSAAAATSPGVESYQSVGSLVVKPDGAVAWIGTSNSIVGNGAPRTEVHAANLHGAVRLLDSGPAVRPRSLTLHGRQLTWKHGDALRHATLT